MSRHSQARRGVILLVVMSLIALFAVVTVGFVLVSTLELKTATQAARAETRADQSFAYLDEAIDQVLRGAKSDRSPLINHSLLEDLYGYDVTAVYTGGVVRGLTRAGQHPPVPGGGGGTFNQVVDIQVEFPLTTYDPSKGTGVAAGYFNGRLLTFVDGPCAGTSVRIIDFLPIEAAPNNGFLQYPILRVFAPKVVDPTTLATSQFIINDRPFDGTGFGLGFDSSGKPLKTINHKLSDNPNRTTEPGWEDAFLPNRSRGAKTLLEWTAVGPSGGTAGDLNGDQSYPDQSGIGGADEDYDAPDFQNMLLAMRIATRGGAYVALPSLHRPDLLRYWKQRMSSGGGVWPPATMANRYDRDLMRKICMRPLVFDHPGFAAVNPALATFNGLADSGTSGTAPLGSSVLIDTNGDGIPDTADPSRAIWDVDNDGDGSPDSVWVDLGMPVQTDSQGRRYKPLFAILCLDMDGRLNLNAHGAPELVRGAAGSPTRGAAKQEYVAPFPNNIASGSPSRASFPTGSGKGPPEIRLNDLFADTPATLTELQQLFFGLYNGALTPPLAIDGRYGEIHLMADGVIPMPGRTTVWSRMTTQSMPSGVDWDHSGSMDVQQVLQVTNGATYIQDMHDDNFPPAPSRYLGYSGVATQALEDLRGNVSQNGMMYYSAYAGVAQYPPVNTAVSLAAWNGTGATPEDFDGDGSVCLDMWGRPYYFLHGEGNDLVDDPYEINLVDTRQVQYWNAVPVTGTATGRAAAVDMPFSPSDLESMLRSFDIDSAALTSRLDFLAPISLSVKADGTQPGMLSAAYRRNILTTESWDLPVANLMLALPELLADNPLGGPNPIMATIPPTLPIPDMSPLAFRYTSLPQLAIILQTFIGSGGSGTNPDFDKELRRILYPEFFESQRLDLSRSFGNSFDDNQNGVIDEPGETVAWPNKPPSFPPTDFGLPQPLWEGSNTAFGTSIYYDGNNDGRADGGTPAQVDRTGDNMLDDQDLLIRQGMARHLYFLALSMRNVIMSQPSMLPPGDIAFTEREVAQWAVNVVDYIDRDSISTGFEFDLAPGMGWAVDGNLNTNENASLAAGATPRRGVVWGLERPELLIGESVAFHDLRTDDTNTDNAASPKLHYSGDPMNRDPDLDQVRRPEGSLILELFNPQGIDQFPPGEFYMRKTSGGSYEFVPGVNLRALDRVTETSPVWRIVVWANPKGRNEDDINKLRKDPQFPSGDPGSDDPSIDNSYAKFGAGNEADEQDYTIERSIYFHEPGGSIQFDGQRYYPSSTEANKAAIVGNGQYAVVGPADNAGHLLIGGFDVASASRPKINFTAYNHPVYGMTTRFEIENDGMSPAYPRYDGDGGGSINPTDEQVRLPVGVVIDSGANSGRMSISEPTTRVYPAKAINPDGSYQQPDDEPFDADGTREDWVTRAGATDGDAGPDSTDKATDQADNDDDDVATPNDLLNYRFLALQRLANPLLPFDRQTNPYLTVDWTPVDLTIFNSTFSPNDLVKLRSRQRAGGDSNPANPTFDPINIWAELPFSEQAPVAGQYRDYSQRDPAPTVDLDHTFGYLNERFHLPAANPGDHRWWTPQGLNALNSDLTSAMNTGSGDLGRMGYDVDYYTGAPKRPFPWINLPNRPLNSPYELMLVPISSPSTLMRQFTLRQNEPMYSHKYGNFGHLMNFFGSNTKGFPIAGGGFTFQNDLYRIFDFMQVKSQFSGTETLLNPNEFSAYPQNTALAGEPIFGWFYQEAGQPAASGSPPGTPPLRPDRYLRNFRPPFNRLSTYREPGKVNLNTMFDEGDTLKAIVGGHYADATHSGVDLWSRFVSSRRGGGAGAPITNALLNMQQLLAHDPDIPSVVANPFRTFSGGFLVPLDNMQRAGVNCTLLRPDPAPTALPAPVAPRNDPEPPMAQNGLFELIGGTMDAPTSNAYFRYQLYNRMGNLVTTRSNVYSVWVTVGNFEVEPVDRTSAYYNTQLNFSPSEFDQVYPDGYRLKTEIGADTGEIKRHRAFYIIDRSIPVGFERGETHNSRNAIVLRRIIE